MEAKLLAGKFRALSAVSTWAQAYESINFPLSEWFFIPEEISESSLAERLEHRQRFADEFNRAFLKIKDKQKSISAGIEMKAGLRLIREATETAWEQKTHSNYRPSIQSQKLLQESIADLISLEKSFEVGDVALETHVRRPKINLKKAFEEPFDTERSQTDPISILVYEDEEEVSLRFSSQIWWDFAASFTPDLKKFRNPFPNPKLRKSTAFLPEVVLRMKDYELLYGPIELANHQIYDPAVRKRSLEERRAP